MGNLADYFYRNSYHAKYTIGDRVFGRYNGIPFVGSVAVDHRLNEDIGPEVVILLDLPLHYQGRFINTVRVKHLDIRPLKQF